MHGRIEFTPEIGDAICERIAGGEPLRAICRDDGMPNFVTVYRWIQRFPEFAAQMEAARLVGFDAIAEQCLDISDDEQHDWVMTKKGLLTNEVAVGRAKLQVYTRLQLLAKWHPKKYGEKVDLNHAGGVTIQVVTGVPHDD